MLFSASSVLKVLPEFAEIFNTEDTEKNENTEKFKDKESRRKGSKSSKNSNSKHNETAGIRPLPPATFLLEDTSAWEPGNRVTQRFEVFPQN